MPVWSREEIRAAHQIIFSQQPDEDVEARYSKWGGIPRYVLQLLHADDQALLDTAINECDMKALTSSMINLSTAAKISHRLVHMTAKDDYCEGPKCFASEWVQLELISRYQTYRQQDVHDFLTASGAQPSIAGFRGKLWERFAHQALQRGGSFWCRDLQTLGEPFQCQLVPCASTAGLWSHTDIVLERGVYGYGKNRNFAAVDAVIQPDKLFQITVSGKHGIDVKGLASATRALQADESVVELYFVVPPDVFDTYTKQTLKRIRGELEAASVAHSVTQYVLKLEI